MKPNVLIPTLAFATCCVGSSNAAILYWDGGASTFNTLSDNATTTAQNWLDAGAGAGNWDDGVSSTALTSWNPGDSAVFGGGTVAPQSVTAGTLTIGDITFGGGGDGSGTTGTNYTLTGGAITLSAGSVVTANTNATIASTLTGSGSLTKQGGAILTLSGTKDFTGGTTVNGGTLTLGTGGAAGVLRGTLAVNSGATVSASTNWSFGHTSGTCVSGVTLNGGTLNFTGTADGGGTSASLITLTGATISGSRWDWFNGITNSAEMVTNASATTATISSGFRLRFNAGSQAKLTVASGTPADGTDLLVSGNITQATNANGIIKDGNGVLRITGTASYTGATTVNAGRVIFSTASNDRFNGSGGLSIAANSTFELRTTGNARFAPGAGNITGAGTFEKTGNFVTYMANGGNRQKLNLSSGGLVWVREGTMSDFETTATNKADLTIETGAIAQQVLAGTAYFDALSGGGTLAIGNNAKVVAGVDDGSGNFAGSITNGFAGTASFEKAGAGTQTLSGSCTHSGATTVSGGTLVVDGSLDNSAVAVSSGGTLAGTGSVKSATVSGILTPGGETLDTLDVTNALTLSPGGKVVCQIDKTGGVLTNDQLIVGSVIYGGTLEVTATGAPLTAGDSFQLFSAVPLNYAGSFSNFILPALTGSLNWDLSNLGVDGMITVVDYAPTPVFTPAAGGYVGAQSITMNSGDGATIYYTYTTNGSEPANPTTSSNAGVPGSGTATFNMPTNSSLWIKAIATKAGSSNSPVASATYATIETPTWTQPLGGDWTVAGNWQAGVSPNGADTIADFSSLDLTDDATVYVDQARTIGSMIFGDTVPSHNWSLDGSALTLDGVSPSITVANQTTTISAPLGGVSALLKNGTGTLVLSNPTYTGGTAVAQGRLVLSNPASATGTGTGGFRTSDISFDAGSTLEFALTSDWRTPNNGMSITGAGTLVKSGSGTLKLGGSTADYANEVTLDSGSLIDIQGGRISLDYAYNKTTWAANKADMHIATGATFDLWDYGNTGSNFVKIDALTGEGTVQRGISGTTSGGLEIGVDDGSGTFSGGILNGVGTAKVNLIKSGTGNQTLAGTNTYTGTTTVNGGTLTLTGSLLLKPTTNGSVNGIGGTSSLVLDGVLVLDLATADTTSGNEWLLVDVSNLSESYAGNFGLTSGAEAFAETTAGSGVWTLTQGANKWTFTESTGVLGVGPAGGFQSWIESFTSLTDPADKLPEADPDKDGVSNIVEFVLNGNPESGAATNAPTVSSSGGNLAFTYTRRDDAEYLNPVVEFDADLQGTWTSAQDGVNCSITVQENDADPDTVTVSIPQGANSRLFARLVVTP
jgi:fibronectin-binding autotransporter adhesin